MALEFVLAEGEEAGGPIHPDPTPQLPGISGAQLPWHQMTGHPLQEKSLMVQSLLELLPIAQQYPLQRELPAVAGLHTEAFALRLYSSSIFLLCSPALWCSLYINSWSQGKI